MVPLPIIPQLSLRLGRENLIYAKGSLMPNGYTGYELPVVQGAIGTGFCGYTSSSFELGYGFSDYSNGVFTASSSVRVADNFKITSNMIFGNKNNSVISMGLIY